MIEAGQVRINPNPKLKKHPYTVIIVMETNIIGETGTPLCITYRNGKFEWRFVYDVEQMYELAQ